MVSFNVIHVLVVGMSVEILGLCAASLHRQRDFWCPLPLGKKSHEDLPYHLVGAGVEPCNATNKLCVVQANKSYKIILGALFKYMVKDGQVNVYALTHRSLIPFPGFKSFDMCDRLFVGGPCPLEPSRTGASFRLNLAFPNKGSMHKLLYDHGGPLRFRVIHIRVEVKNSLGAIIYCNELYFCYEKPCHLQT